MTAPVLTDNQCMAIYNALDEFGERFVDYGLPHIATGSAVESDVCDLIREAAANMAALEAKT